MTSNEIYNNISEYFSTPMRKWVLDDVYNMAEDDYSVSDYCQKVVNYGCSSGVVTSMIYYTDTIKFYDNFVNEINDLLVNYDVNPADIIGDDDDKLFISDYSKNKLAWYAYEAIVYEILECIENL